MLAYQSRSGILRHLIAASVVFLSSLAGVPAHSARAATFTVVTPSNPDGWQAANVRTDATVGITASQPRAGNGSLEFNTNTVTSGQDKADYVKYWGVVPGRTLGNLSALAYEFYRASSSTGNSTFLAPAFRLAYQNTSGQTGYLIWEPVYNGYPASVPTDQWVPANIFSGYFWMRAFGAPSVTIENYTVTLAQWIAGNQNGNPITDPSNRVPHALDANTSITGIEVGVGSGWGGQFRGFVDNVQATFGADDVTANFEPNPPCTTVCYVDAVNGNDSNTGVSTATAFKTIQKGLTTVQPAGMVMVAAGTYTETLVVNKALTLKGAQAGVLAKGRAGPESIIRNSTGSVTPLDVQADNVTVDGFTFNSAGLTAAPWTITAINEPGNGRFANLKVLNNTFVGNPDTTGNGTFPGGMYVFNADDALIEGNYFNALGQHAVFMGNTSTNTTYRNNDSFQNYNSNFSAHVGPHTGVLIENNRMVEDTAVLFKIDGLTIRNNVLTSSATTSARFYIGGGNSNILVEKNTWNSTRSAPVVIFDAGFGYGANSNATVQDNVLNARPDYVDQSAGATLIDLRDVAGTSVIARNLITYTGNYTGAVHGIGVRGNMGNVTISENEVTGSNADTDASTSSAGIILRSTLTSTAVITVLNNKASGFINGVEVQQVVAGVTAKVNLNSITGNSVNGLLNGTTLVDGEKNWWGNATGPTNAGNPSGSGAVVAGNVDFDPWLCDGTDTSASIGFQPNASVICGGNPPDTFIAGTPLTLTNALTASFTFTGSDDVTPAVNLGFECKLDAGSFAACASPKLYTGLSDGSHVFSVRAKDPAGSVDASPAAFTWTVDATPPTSAILSGPLTTTTNLTATFTFTGSDNLTAPQALKFECSLDGGAWTTCTSPYTVSGLSVGTHQMQVRARDEAGNVQSTPAAFAWTVVLPEGAKRFVYLPLVSR